MHGAWVPPIGGYWEFEYRSHRNHPTLAGTDAWELVLGDVLEWKPSENKR